MALEGLQRPRALEELRVVLAAEHDGGGRVRTAAEGGQHLEAGDPGHEEVQEQAVETAAVLILEERAAAGERGYAEIVRPEQALQGAAKILFIIDNSDQGRGAHPASTPVPGYGLTSGQSALICAARMTFDQ